MSNPIIIHVKTAFNYFEDMSANKMFSLARPLLKSSSPITLTMNIDYDFKGAEQAGTVDVPAGVGAKLSYFSDWISINGLGYCAALEISGAAADLTMDWYGWAITYQRGGIL